MVHVDAAIFVAIMFALFGFVIGSAVSRRRFGRLAYKQGLYDGKMKKLLHWCNWFDDVKDYEELNKWEE